jgi:DNA-binding HxlR family transcriptional regulator
LLIYLLSRGKQRYGDLHRQVGGISQKMLTQTLRKLERDGLVTRQVFPEVPPRTEYELTKLGHTLIGPMSALCEWAGAHLAELETARKRYDQLQEKRSLIA